MHSLQCMWLNRRRGARSVSQRSARSRCNSARTALYSASTRQHMYAVQREDRVVYTTRDARGAIDGGVVADRQNCGVGVVVQQYGVLHEYTGIRRVKCTHSLQISRDRSPSPLWQRILCPNLSFGIDASHPPRCVRCSAALSLLSIHC